MLSLRSSLFASSSRVRPTLWLILSIGFTSTWVGCQSTTPSTPSAAAAVSETLTIGEGDVLKVSFAGAPNLDTEQQVRRDGRITLGVVGEVSVAGSTPSQVEQQLRELYSTQLVSKEVSVTVVTSRFVVFVTGAVIHPGKVTVDHPLTALEALMEAGGFDNSRADSKNVVVIRQAAGKTNNLRINLKEVLEGRSNEPFNLKQFDILYVPEKFTWF